MARKNLIARFGAKVDELAAAQKGELAVLTAEVRPFGWSCTSAITLRAFIVTLLQLVAAAKGPD